MSEHFHHRNCCTNLFADAIACPMAQTPFRPYLQIVVVGALGFMVHHRFNYCARKDLPCLQPLNLRLLLAYDIKSCSG